MHNDPYTHFIAGNGLLFHADQTHPSPSFFQIRTIKKSTTVVVLSILPDAQKLASSLQGHKFTPRAYIPPEEFYARVAQMQPTPKVLAILRSVYIDGLTRPLAAKLNDVSVSAVRELLHSFSTPPTPLNAPLGLTRP